jgi:tripartite-type tricarboxylate transporter receptor subunit TctC
MMFNGLPSALPQVKAGRLRALAVAGAKRTSLLPDLPTIAESGIVYDTSGWYGLVAPRGTPPAIVATLQRSLAKALATPDMQKRLADLGIDPIGSTPEELARFLKEEQVKWTKVVKAVGIKPH